MFSASVKGGRVLEKAALETGIFHGPAKGIDFGNVR